MYGADADQLDAVAARVGGAAQRLTVSRATIGRQVNASPWQGRSADHFRSTWASEYSRSMQAAASFLHDAAATLGRNAAEQRQASGVAGGFCRVPSSPERSLWDRWLDGSLGEKWNGPLKLLMKTVAKFGTFGFFGYQDWMISKGLFSLGREFTSLGGKVVKIGSAVPVLNVLVGGFTMWDSWNDLHDHEYTGNFDHVETYVDSLNFVAGGAMVAGGILLATPLAPVGAAIIAGAAVVSVAGLAVDLGMKAWDKWGGRELWRNSVSPALRDTWNSAKDLAGGATRAVGRAADRAASTLRDVGRGLLNTFRPRRPSWI